MRGKRAQIISQRSNLSQNSTKLRNSHNRRRILMGQKKPTVQSKWWKAKCRNQTRKAYHLDSLQVIHNRCLYYKTTVKARQAKILSLNSKFMATRKEKHLHFRYLGRIHKMLKPKIPVIMAVLDPNTTQTMCSKKEEEVLIRCRLKRQILAISNTHLSIQEDQTAQKSNNLILFQERKSQDMQVKPLVKLFTTLVPKKGLLSIKVQDRVYSHLMLALQGTFLLLKRKRNNQHRTTLIKLRSTLLMLQGFRFSNNSLLCSNSNKWVKLNSREMRVIRVNKTYRTLSWLYSRNSSKNAQRRFSSKLNQLQPNCSIRREKSWEISKQQVPQSAKKTVSSLNSLKMHWDKSMISLKDSGFFKTSWVIPKIRYTL